MANKNRVSAVIITLNNEDTLEATLRTLDWCDEIVVVDSGSTDGTKDLCLRYSCKFFFHPFDGYGAQKQFATSLAENDWILSIDSDEVISEALQEELKSIFAQDQIRHAGFNIIISLVFMGKIFRYGKEANLAHLRLYNRKFGGFNEDKLHEKIILQGEVKKLRNVVIHYSYRDITHYFEKFNRFTSYAAIDALRKKKKVSQLKILVKFPAAFFIAYFIQLNFLNGFPGFIWSVNTAFYNLVKYLKLYEKINIKS
jgi:glycosyltransferase involved in cell wall biosynthesis